MLEKYSIVPLRKLSCSRFLFDQKKEDLRLRRFCFGGALWQKRMNVSNMETKESGCCRLTASFFLKPLLPLVLQLPLAAILWHVWPITARTLGKKMGVEKMFWLSLDCASGFVNTTFFVRKRLTKRKYQRMPSKKAWA